MHHRYTPRQLHRLRLVPQQPPPDLWRALFSLDEIAQPRDTLFSLDAADGKSEVQRDACTAVVRAFGLSSRGDDDAGVGGGHAGTADGSGTGAAPCARARAADV